MAARCRPALPSCWEHRSPPPVESAWTQFSAGGDAAIAPPTGREESLRASEALRFRQALASFLHLTVIGERESVDEEEAWLGILFENLPVGRAGYLY